MSTAAKPVADSPWTLVADHAQLAIGSLRATLPHASPDQGISQIAWQSQPLRDFRLLQLRSPACSPTPPPLLDAYVRNCDLVASYAEAKRGAVQPHVYFRAGENDSAAGLELIVSMQTSLLDSEPESLVTSQLPAMDVMVLDSIHEQVPGALPLTGLPLNYQGLAGKAAYLFLFRLTDSLSYAEMVHPGDFVSAVLEQASAPQSGTPILKLTWRLFPERLEKGVIRRCRIAGWFLPREGDQRRAADLFRQMLEEPLPLTA